LNKKSVKRENFAPEKKRPKDLNTPQKPIVRKARKNTSPWKWTGRRKNTLIWRRLDNAAKIFPPIAHGAHTSVFRLSCELNEQVNPELLSQALNHTLKKYPHMQMVMRRGVFWYYLEQSDISPIVTEEHAPPCAPLYHGSRSLLFEITYWRCKVNIEVFHVLTDGTGAISFFQTLMADYLHLCHPELEAPSVTDKASAHSRSEDGFDKYYEPYSVRYQKQRRAFHLRGMHRPDGCQTILEGVADVRQVLAAAHRYDVTLTIYLCAVLIKAIRGEMRHLDLRRPVVLTVPVNLRNYFPTDTARNFFATIRVPYDFGSRSGKFEDIMAAVDEAFKNELTANRLASRMNTMTALEHNPVLRAVPLFLKNPVLRLSGYISSIGETAAISNIGRFKLPEIYQPYVKGFGAFMSTKCTMLCTCAFGQSFHMGFTSVLQPLEVQRRFFQILRDDGIELEIRSNEFFDSDEA